MTCIAIFLELEWVIELLACSKPVLASDVFNVLFMGIPFDYSMRLPSQLVRISANVKAVHTLLELFHFARLFNQLKVG
jgi:hypothetical protein